MRTKTITTIVFLLVCMASFAKGTLNDPYSVAEACAAVSNLSWTNNSVYETTDDVYVKGVISRISDYGTYTESGTFGNAMFYIKDAGGSKELYCYRLYYFGFQKFTEGQTDIKVGDEVIIYGKLMNYKNTTPETVANQTCLYSLNGMIGNGTPDHPYNVKAATEVAKKLTWTSNSVYETIDDVYVKGVISSIGYHGTYDESGTFGNATFYIKDAGGSEEFYCYRVYYFDFRKFNPGETDIKVGDEVIIYGMLMNYKNTTPETVANQACLYKLNGFGFGTPANPYSVKTALEVASNLSWTSNSVYETTDDVYVKGVISSIANLGTYTESGIFGNASFYIKDDGGSEEFYCYRVYYLGNQKFVEGQTDIEVGDEVIICGKLMNFRNTTPETVANQAYLYSLNGKIGHPTAITATIPETTAHNRYYSTSGQRIDGKPTQKGVYIINGKKVLVINSQ